jgi:hypothetical protein
VPTAAGAHSVAVSRNNNHIFVAVNNEGSASTPRTDEDRLNSGFNREGDPGTGE